MSRALTLTACLILPLLQQCYTSECDTYKEIKNWQRSAGYILDPKSQASFCDIGLLNGWYRFTSRAGGTIPDKCPPPFACGTTGSVWADGTLPKNVGDVINATACVRVERECCASSWGIFIKKCKKNNEHFYVYFLRRPPGCMSYCGGTETPCPPGSNSPNGFTPGCTKLFPAVSKSPVAYPGVKNNRIIFICQIASEDRGNHSNFEVTWYEGTPVRKIAQTTILTGSERVATLQNSNRYPNDPLFYLGTTISCRVRSWYSYSKNRTSAYFESNHYFAGITVEPKQLHLKVSEGKKPLKLIVKATVPIVCEKSQLGCQVLVDLGQDNSQNFLDLCTVVFKTGPANQTKSVEVYAKRDFITDGDRLMVLKIDVLEHIDPVDWNQHRRVPNVQITTEDVGTAICQTSGDPHLRTFDGLNYNHYQVGDYVLVQSSCRKFEVHVRTWKCASVSCNCGIAAREGDDIIVVDMCRDRIPRARFASRAEPADGTSIRRDNNGKSFIITFPSGAFVRIDTHKWFANWYYANFVVQVPSDDFKCTKGLCGTFDGNSKNDLTGKGGKLWQTLGKGRTADGFSESWKLPAGTSLFYNKGGEVKCNATRAKHFCTCKEKAGHRPVVNCRFTSIVNKPKYLQGQRGWKNLKFPGGEHCGKRKRRSLADDIVLPDDRDLADYLYNPDPLVNISISEWPTPLGKTLQNVKSHCTDAVKASEAGMVCKRIENFYFTPFIEQCIEDVQITDNYTFTESAVLTMQSACEEIFLKNTSLWKIDPTRNNTFGPPPDMGNTLCPNLCSGHGSCVNATCICNENFTSVDCSIEMNKAPTVTSIANHGLCDIRKGTGCLRIRVNGWDFIDSANLTCRIQQIKISDSPFEKTNKSWTTAGYLLSFGEVMCELKKTTQIEVDGFLSGSPGVPYVGYLADVSNDGKIYSDTPALYIAHDSKCMDCRPITGICKVKPESCFINGYCFRRNEDNPLERCSKCIPEQSQSSFSKDFQQNCSTTTTKATTGAKMTTKDAISKTNIKKASLGTSIAPTSDPKVKKPKRIKESSKTNIIVISCSAVGAVILIALIILVVHKFKNTHQPQILKEVVTPSSEHKKYDARTFVNATFEGN